MMVIPCSFEAVSLSLALNIAPLPFRRPLGVVLQKLAGASLLVFANKQDLAGSLGAKEIAEILDLESQQFATRHWNIIGCSAVTGEGLADGIDWTVGDIGERIFMMS